MKILTLSPNEIFALQQQQPDRKKIVWRLTLPRSSLALTYYTVCRDCQFKVGWQMRSCALEFITLTVITLTTHMPHLLLTPQPSRANQPSQYGRIAIRGKKAGRFICMNFTGEVYSSPTYTDDCEFQEQPVGNTLYAYYSLKYSGHKKQRKRKWYLGINKRGKMRLGFRTKYNRPFAQFITTSNVTQFPTPPFPAPPQPTPRLTTTSPRVTSPTTTKKPGRRRPQRVPCVSSGPFSRCSNNGGGGRRKKDGKNKRKNKKRKRKSRRHRRKHWRRRPRPLHRSDRSKVPLLSSARSSRRTNSYVAGSGVVRTPMSGQSKGTCRGEGQTRRARTPASLCSDERTLHRPLARDSLLQ
ncbi:hypothetical protein LSAT2_020712 [Lamellibrachia satsuma]|nr:hypothetical protein LSAT2_020712 [Lamellibrachia satsuma]